MTESAFVRVYPAVQQWSHYQTCLKKGRLAPKGRVTRMFIVSRPAPTTSLVTFNCLLLSSQRTQHRANLNTPDSGTVLGIRKVDSNDRSHFLIWSCLGSLVPRPHPLTRRNGLVNQVDFLGLAHAFATM